MNVNERYTKLYNKYNELKCVHFTKDKTWKNHVPLFITSKGFCKQCIQIS